METNIIISYQIKLIIINMLMLMLRSCSTFQGTLYWWSFSSSVFTFHFIFISIIYLKNFTPKIIDNFYINFFFSLIIHQNFSNTKFHVQTSTSTLYFFCVRNRFKKSRNSHYSWKNEFDLCFYPLYFISHLWPQIKELNLG